MAKTTRCKNCIFWSADRKEDNAVGECHRYAPRPYPEAEVNWAAWPYTRGEDFCGDGQKTKASPPIPSFIRIPKPDKS